MKTIKFFLLLGATSLTVSGCSLVLDSGSSSKAPFTSPAMVDEYQRTEAEQLIKNGALVLDVRSPEEFSRGHLAQAVNVPYTQIRSRIGSVAKDKSQAIIVYCQSGRRAEVAREDLQEMGYSRVVNAGGIPAKD